MIKARKPRTEKQLVDWLDKHCSDEMARMGRPVQLGEWVVATDGRSMVGVYSPVRFGADRDKWPIQPVQDPPSYPDPEGAIPNREMVAQVTVDADRLREMLNGMVGPVTIKLYGEEVPIEIVSPEYWGLLMPMMVRGTFKSTARRPDFRPVAPR